MVVFILFPPQKTQISISLLGPHMALKRILRTHYFIPKDSPGHVVPLVGDLSGAIICSIYKYCFGVAF